MAQTTAFFATHSDRCLARTHADDQYTYESHLHAFIFDKTTINQWKHAFDVLNSVSDNGGSCFFDSKMIGYWQYRSTLMMFDIILVSCCVHVAQANLQEPKSSQSKSTKKLSSHLFAQTTTTNEFAMIIWHRMISNNIRDAREWLIGVWVLSTSLERPRRDRHCDPKKGLCGGAFSKWLKRPLHLRVGQSDQIHSFWCD